MIPITHAQSIRLSITRLRTGAIFCCWIVGLALACQALIWALASYTQLRYEAAAVAAPVQAAPVVVKSEPQNAQRGRILAPANGTDEPPAATTEEPPGPVLSQYDRWFASAFDVAGGVGRIAMIVLLAILALAVTLAANVAVQGGERAVLAFIWAVLVAVLVLPFGQSLHLPWEDGALSTYAHMISWVDPIEANRVAALAGQSTDVAAPSVLLSHARFLVLPLACIVGIVLTGLRFSVAVEAAIVKRESMRLDPALEREASNISPTSLHGGRSASIISRTIMPEPDPEPVAIAKSEDDGPPKRLI